MNSEFGKFFFDRFYFTERTKEQKYFSSQAENIVFGNQSNL